MTNRLRSKRTLAVTGILALFVAASPAVLDAAPSAAIVGGENVGAYSWAAALLLKDDGTPKLWRFRCSGTLIKSTWVLTAAHCFDPDINGVAMGVGDTVIIGRDDLEVAGGNVRSIAEVKFMRDSPTYCDVTDKWALCDVALVRLSSASTLADLDLADASEVAEWGVGTIARAYGYGSTCATCVSSLDLKRVTTEITSLRSNGFTMFARATNGAVCYGDSGGPLIVSTSNGPRIVGVVRARTADDESSCSWYDESSYVKVGERTSSGISKPFLWIVANV